MSEAYSFYLVDDDPALLALLSKVLEKHGHSVRANTDSVEALQEINELKPDCVLTDIMMPGMDGLELCKKIKENPDLQGVRVGIVSGKTYDFDRRRAREFGADGYITKPVKPDSLMEQVMSMLTDSMVITYYGVRGTLPVSGEKALKYGGNTNCVTLHTGKDELFIFDAGSGIKTLADDLMSKGSRLTGKILISHPHWDHINAFPFFTPLYVPGNEFEVCGASHGDLSMRELISAQMDGVYFPITIREFGARVFFRNLHEESIDFDGVRVDTMLLSHPGYCLGYRVTHNGKSMAYVTDNELFVPELPQYNEHYVKRLIAFVEDVDVLITDTTYTDEEYRSSKVGWGHSCVSQVVDLAHRARVKTLHLYHHDPDQDDDAIDVKLGMAEETLSGLGSSTKVIAPTERSTHRV